GRSGKLLFEIGDDQGNRQRRLHLSGKSMQPVTARRNRSGNVEADREQLRGCSHHFTFSQPISQHYPVHPLEVYAGRAQLGGGAAPGSRRENAPDQRKRAGQQPVGSGPTASSPAFTLTANTDEIVAGTFHRECQLRILVNVIIVVEVQLVTALVQKAEVGVKSRA